MRSKANRGKLICWLVLLATVLPWPGMAQTKIQVVTKTITRKLDYQKGTQLRITGEKAKVNLKGWDRNYIGVTIRLSAKHPDRNVAEKELEHLQYFLKQNDNLHELGNYFLIGKGSKPIAANLKAEYEVSVPENLPVTISCKFGEVNLENTKGIYKIDLEYGLLNLKEVAGEMTAQLVMSDLKSTNTNLTLKCKAEKADIDLANAAGSYQIQNAYGQVRLASGATLRHVNIQASRTGVTLITREFDGYNYDLSTSHAALALPAQAKPQVKLTSGQKSTYQYFGGESMPTIKINTTYSPITIRNQAN